MLIIFCKNVYAINENAANITSELIKSKPQDNIIEARLKIKMNNISEGINAYTGKLKYNNDQLKLIEIKGLNGWDLPIYKEQNGEIKVAATNIIFSKENQEILFIKFEKINEETEYEISFENLEVATKINGITTKVTEGLQMEIQEETKGTEEDAIQEETKGTEENAIEEQEINEKKEKKSLKQIICTIITAIIITILVLLIAFGFYQKAQGGNCNEKSK